MAELEEPKTVNQGICSKCRRTLPASSFRRNTTGNMTTWCEPCRQLCAKNWIIDEDLVELVFELYVFEQGLRKEAEILMLAKVNMGQAEPKALTDMKSKAHNHHMLRHTRIPAALRLFLLEYRSKYFYAVGMDAPEIVVPWVTE